MDEEYTLAQLRATKKLRQSDVADAMGLGREAVGFRETRPLNRQTVRGLMDYAYALGGVLELTISLDGKRYKLKVDEEG